MCDMVRNRQQYIAIRLNTSCSKCVQPPNNRNSREAEQQTPTCGSEAKQPETARNRNSQKHYTPTCGSEAKQRRTLWGRSGRETETPTRRSIKFPIFGLFCPPSSQNLWRNDSKYVICHISSIPKMPSRCLPWEHTSNFQFVKHS